jgi:class 3 adenylate cyclase
VEAVTFTSELEQQVRQFFGKPWKRRDGLVVPDAEDVALSNDGVDLEAAVLYADLAESTRLVAEKKDVFAAAVYKSFLYCAARIIERRGGVVTAYDGDRVMGVFIGDSKRTEAARAALGINHATKKIVMPALKAKYTSSEYVVRHCVGTSAGCWSRAPVFAARTTWCGWDERRTVLRVSPRFASDIRPSSAPRSTPA